MQIITLTTDLGLKDHYVGAVKGNLAKALPEARMIDISNHIQPFNIIEAAFVLKNAYREFPEGTIHLVSVDKSDRHRNRAVLAAYDDHYFIGPDSGLLSLVFERHPDRLIELEVQGPSTFPLKELLLPAAIRLAQGSDPESLGKPMNNLEVKHLIQPTVMGNKITGSVLYVDHYGNAVTNITMGLLEDKEFSSLEVQFHRESIERISSDYFQVPSGEKLCLFNSSGYLEIAINQGNANLLLGLNPNDSVQLILS